MSDLKTSNHVKILLDIEGDDGTTDVESVWAVPENGNYRIDNIPFYARGFALGDLVAATPDPDGLLRCTGVVMPSGHSTVRLWFANSTRVQEVRAELQALGCSDELDLDRLLAVDIPPQIPFAQVKAFLDEKESDQILEYEEGCLGQG